MQSWWLDRPSPRRLQDETPSVTPQKAHHSHFDIQLAQHSEEVPVADDEATMETRWRQVWAAIHSTALGVFGRASRQNQDWVDNNDGDISQQPTEKNRPCKTDVNHWIAENMVAFSTFIGPCSSN
nr:unnamed protein product [Spirometra erinaceieuropaei]